MKKSIPIKTNIIKQNCYIRECSPALDLKTDSKKEQFYQSMEEHIEKDCLRHILVDVPYEITPDYVNSFAQSADYRNDPIGAIVNAPVGRQNLGDITEYQKVSQMDDTQARDLFNQLKKRFSKSAADKAAADKAVAENNGEVK